jgi:hypothetical protein
MLFMLLDWPAHELAAMGVEVADGETEFWIVSYLDIVNRLVTGDSAVF